MGRIIRIKIVFLLISTTLLFNCLQRYPISYIKFTVNDEKNYLIEDEKNTVLNGVDSYNNVVDNYVYDKYRDKTTLMYRIDNDNKIIFVLEYIDKTTIAQKNDIKVEKFEVVGNIDKYFDERYLYKDINILVNYKGYGSWDKDSDEFIFSGTINYDISDDNYEMTISEGYVVSGFNNY